MAIDRDDDRVPQILYGELANLKNDPSEYVLKVTVPCACWKTDEEVEFDQAPGHVFITDSQVLFQCSQTQEHSVAIDAECIVLHAQSDDQILYLQLQEIPANDSEVMELTLTVTTSDDCERLFQALSHLISQHPVYGDDEDDDGMMGDYGEDMIVASDEHDRPQQQQLPTDEERNAMLDRLDAMLVIPPHLHDNSNYNEEEGQFDDADDDIL